MVRLVKTSREIVLRGRATAKTKARDAYVPFPILKTVAGCTISVPGGTTREHSTCTYWMVVLDGHGVVTGTHFHESGHPRAAAGFELI